MIKIAFCDDDLSVLNELRALLDRYRVEKDCDISYTAFLSSLELLAEIERGTRYDILFLDVLMPGENGIDAAAEIRNYDTNIKIIFLSSSPEFAVQSYTVSAFFYQLKPIREESFFRLMDSVLSTCEKEQSSSLILRCKTGITRIDPSRVEYCEVIHHTLFIHLSNGKTLESIGSLEELSQKLQPFGCFLRPHRSYLVNMNYIQSISYRTVTMSCLTEIPIPRGKQSEINNIYLEYMFQQGQVNV